MRSLRLSEDIWVSSLVLDEVTGLAHPPLVQQFGELTCLVVGHLGAPLLGELVNWVSSPNWDQAFEFELQNSG